MYIYIYIYTVCVCVCVCVFIFRRLFQISLEIHHQGNKDLIFNHFFFLWFRKLFPKFCLTRIYIYIYIYVYIPFCLITCVQLV